MGPLGRLYIHLHHWGDTEEAGGEGAVVLQVCRDPHSAPSPYLSALFNAYSSVELCVAICGYGLAGPTLQAAQCVGTYRGRWNKAAPNWRLQNPHIARLPKPTHISPIAPRIHWVITEMIGVNYMVMPVIWLSIVK